jgi:hypothetical protein
MLYPAFNIRAAISASSPNMMGSEKLLTTFKTSFRYAEKESERKVVLNPNLDLSLYSRV